MVYLCEVCHQRVRGGGGGVQCLVLPLPLPPLVFGRSSVFVEPSESLTALSLPPVAGVQEILTVLLEEDSTGSAPTRNCKTRFHDNMGHRSFWKTEPMCPDVYSADRRVTLCLSAVRKHSSSTSCLSNRKHKSKLKCCSEATQNPFLVYKEPNLPQSAIKK